MSRKGPLYLVMILSLTIGFALGYMCANEKSFLMRPGANLTNDKKDNTISFKNINKDGSFVLSEFNKQIFIKKDFTEDNKTIRQFEWYTDALCGDCIRTHQNTQKKILEEVLNKKMEIKFHPLNFLPHRNDFDYSLKVASFISAVAENLPEKTLLFMEKVYDKDFRDKNKTSENIYHILYHILIDNLQIDAKIGSKILADIEQYENAINRGSVGIRKFEKWKEISPKDDQSFFVPFIYNKSGGKAFLGEEEDTSKFVLAPLMGEVDCDFECE